LRGGGLLDRFPLCANQKSALVLYFVAFSFGKPVSTFPENTLVGRLPMFFYASKLFWLLAQPSNACVLILGLGLLLAVRGASLGRRLAGAGFAAILLLGFSPLGSALIYPLEQRFAGLPEPSAADHIAGIIMLGGFEDAWVSAGRPGLALNEAGERLTGTLLLARRLPDAKVIFTGGNGSLTTSETAENSIEAYLLAIGISRERMVLEHQSRTTWENATFLRDILKPVAGQRFALVTSAFHMPRAVGAFRRAGFDVVPYPVDYRTRGFIDLIYPFSAMPEGLQRVDFAAKEWVGLVGYWLGGRSDALWPGP
jgi:uncharacterized SAM-binding protein YcdF (DUF218 family)